jgi:hypothetical protein
LLLSHKRQVAKLFNPHEGVSLVLRAAPLCCNDLLRTGGIVCNKLLAALLENFGPFLVSSSAMFLGLRAATAFCRSHHILSIGFKSEDCDGHSRTFESLFSNHAFVDFDVCLGVIVLLECPMMSKLFYELGDILGENILVFYMNP